MPALIPTEYRGEITWLGRVVRGSGTIRAEPLSEAFASFDGFEGEIHGGATRPSCVRVSAQYPKGTEIRNVRQLSVLSYEELQATAQAMGLEHLDPCLVGASMILRGIPDFTHVPPGARLQCEDTGATITVDMENRPCVFPGREIEMEHKGFGAAYKPAAKNRRGVTAWVEREGLFRVGANVRLHIPDQRGWCPTGDLFA